MDDYKLRKQISLWLDGALSEPEVRRLEKRLEESADARHTFLIATRFHAEFCNDARGQELLAELEGKEPFDPKQLAPPYARSAAEPDAGFIHDGRRSRSMTRAFGAIAATVLLAFGLLLSRPQAGRDDEGVALADLNAAAEAEAVEEPILTGIEPVSDDCHWYIEAAQSSDPSTCKPGDVIRVTAGSLSLRYQHETGVVLHAPAAYQVVSAWQGKMIVGRLTATVPEAGKGFTVITPRADVIDLGTEFGVNVSNDGVTDVVVFKGEVDLAYHEQGAEAQRLKMGEAVRLDVGGTASRLVSVDGEAYANGPIFDSSHLPVIVEVRDNIDRESAVFNYYEIMRGGMREDALSHVDRVAHEYNGVTVAGMPEYLVGADYVKTFNNDKYLKQIRIDVTLRQPARLYVLLDNRHEPPAWLTAQFTDTGDDIGLDTGPFQSIGPTWHNKGPSGVGPGESIDDSLSIWVREIDTPQVVQLGPTGGVAEVGANMYGIAATPLVFGTN